MSTEIEKMHLSEIVTKLHIIVGSGGRCMCGIYDGEAWTCADILKLKSPDILAAIIIADTAEKLGGTPVNLTSSHQYRVRASLLQLRHHPKLPQRLP